MLLLLGCHSGLVPNLGPDDLPSLVEGFARFGQPTFGYTAFAYAVDSDGESPTKTVYSERLQALLVLRLLSVTGETPSTLGEVLAAALADYPTYSSAQNDPLSVKTLDTMTLYGPPDYDIIVPTLQAQPNRDSSSSPVLSQSVTETPTSLSIAPTYTEQRFPQGSIYVASLSSDEPIQLMAVGQTVQPGARVQLPDQVTGALLVGGRYRDIPQTDPVIVRAAPLGLADAGYVEPAYNGGMYDWASPGALHQDADNIRWLSMPLGQWALVIASNGSLITLMFVFLRQGMHRSRLCPLSIV